MSRRPLLKAHQWSALVDMPTDEESLIRHCTLDRAELNLIQAKRAPHNRPPEALIDLCEAAMVVRTIPPGPAVQQAPKEAGAAAASAAPPPPPPRGRVGTGH